MSEAIQAFLAARGISPEISVFIISLFPILELRGGLIAAAAMGIPMARAAIICVIGNLVPIPFILLFIKQIFAFMKKRGILVKFVEWCERRGQSGSEKIKQGQMLGLLLFVAIPLPGTGGWTGALIASILNMEIKRSLPMIFLGVIVACGIMLILTYFLPGLFGF